MPKGTRRDCFIFVNGDELVVDLELFPSAKSACEILATGWGVSLEQLANW